MILSNRTIHTLAVGAVLIGSTVVYGDRLRNVKLREPIPEFSLKLTNGNTITSETLRGKVVLLVFLSAEQKSSEQAAVAAHDVFATIKSKSMELLFVTADTNREPYFRQHRSRNRIHEPLGMDFDRDLYGKLGLIVLPTTIGIDRKGELAFVISGYKSDYQHVLEANARYALGLIDEQELKKRLTAKVFHRDLPSVHAARHVAAARLLREKGLLTDAERELKAAIELDQGNTDIQLALASLYIRLEKIDLAAPLVDGVLGKHPDHRAAKLLHGIVLFHRGKLDEAEVVLKKSLVLNPDPVRNHYYLGMLYEKKGDKDKAIAHYHEALSRLMGASSIWRPR